MHAKTSAGSDISKEISGNLFCNKELLMKAMQHDKEKQCDI